MQNSKKETTRTIKQNYKKVSGWISAKEAKALLENLISDEKKERFSFHKMFVKRPQGQKNVPPTTICKIAQNFVTTPPSLIFVEVINE